MFDFHRISNLKVKKIGLEMDDEDNDATVDCY